MKFVSKLALGAALAVSTSLAATAPASAQRNNQKPAAAPAPDQLKVSDGFRAAAAPAQATLDNTAVPGPQRAAAADAQVKAAEALVTNDDEKYFAAWLRLRVEALRNNEAAEIAPLEVLIASPRTAPEQKVVYQRLLPYIKGSLAGKDKKYAEAIPQLLEARRLGNNDSDLAIQLANAYNATGKTAEVAGEVDIAIKSVEAAGKKAPADWYKFAIPRVKTTGDRAAMATWLTRFIQAYPTVPNWRWAVLVYAQGAQNGARDEKIALSRLMRATNVLADKNDYVSYAYTVQQAGLPWEAIAVIDEGRKAGKIPAGDRDAAGTYTAAQAGVKAEGSLETTAKNAKTAKALQNTGDAFLAQGNYTRALALYDQALAGGATNADEINLNRGVALRGLGRKDEAKAAFQAVKSVPFGNIALLWQSSLDFPPLTA